MARNLFSSLRRYSLGTISQDENYVTEALATLLDEFPSFRTTLLRELFQQEIGHEAFVRTQVSYETTQFGRAILDLVIEDKSKFIIVEVKVESGLNYYESADDSNKQVDQQTYDQIQKYEDCVGLPEKTIAIFLLSKYPLNLETTRYKYFKPDTNHVLWRRLWVVTDRYCRSLQGETPEKYLLGKLLDYLKERGMAGFQGFKIQHLATLSWQAETEVICSDFKMLITENIAIEGFESRKQTAYGRDGVMYVQPKPYAGIFLGLWLSDQPYYFKFPLETGPQIIAFVEVDPTGQLKKHLLESEAYRKVSQEFGRQTNGWQILLRHKPLAEFLGSTDQARLLLEFFRESIYDLQQSGLLGEIVSQKQ